MNNEDRIVYRQDNKRISPTMGNYDITTLYRNDLMNLNKQNNFYAIYDNNCQSCTGGGNILYIINPLNNKLYYLNTKEGIKIIKYYIDFSLNKSNNNLFNILIINNKKYKTKSIKGLQKIIYLMNKYIKPQL